MPIYLPPLSRRRFLLGSVAAASGLALGDRLGAAEPPRPDPHRFALLSDTHIAADPTAVLRDVTMAEHLKKVVAEVASLSPRPANAIVNGDLALATGESGDYATFLELVRPLRAGGPAGGMPIHLALGNHDHRERFRAALPERERVDSPLKDREAYKIESPRADWFVLDSLLDTNGVPGTVGASQLAWLAGWLDARKDRPAIVMVHHNPDPDPKHNGLTDTKALLDLIRPRKRVKALLFGHTHHWSLEEDEGLHLVNLPAVSYVFQKGDPTGWVDAKVSETGMTMELRCVDRAHKQHGEKQELPWRKA